MGPGSDSTGDAAALPELKIEDPVDSSFAEADVQAAWNTVGGWILTTGFQPTLIATITPTAGQLTTLTDQMTAACATTVRSYAATPNAQNTDNLETVTAIGVRSPRGTLATGEDTVTGRVITSASARLVDNALTIVAVSSANIHFVASGQAARRFHSTFERTTTYTLDKQDGRWLVDNWRGTYRTTDPIDD